MRHLRFRFDCVRPDWHKEPRVEPRVHESGDHIIVLCRLSNNRRLLPKDWLSREILGLIVDTLLGSFRISIL